MDLAQLVEDGLVSEDELKLLKETLYMVANLDNIYTLNSVANFAKQEAARIRKENNDG